MLPELKNFKIHLSKTISFSWEINTDSYSEWHNLQSDQ